MMGLLLLDVEAHLFDRRLTDGKGPEPGGALGNSWPPNVPSAPIGRTAMGRLTQGGAREAGLPWAGIPAHR